MVLQLVPEAEYHEVVALPTSGSVTFGRKECTHCIQHKKVSGVHCELLLESQDGVLTVHVKDRSTNGTFVDGSLVSKTKPSRLMIGSTLGFANPVAQATARAIPLFTLVDSALTQAGEEENPPVEDHAGYDIAVVSEPSGAASTTAHAVSSRMAKPHPRLPAATCCSCLPQAEPTSDAFDDPLTKMKICCCRGAP